MQLPEISVVIPTYQCALAIERAIRSALSQEGVGFEVVVVDDGSTDGTDAAVAAIDDVRLRYLPVEHAGRSAARNAGVRAARYDIVTFLDSDDAALPDWLASLSRMFVEPDTAIACCGLRVEIRGSGGMQQRDVFPGNMGPVYSGQVGLFLAGSFAVTKGLLLDVGGFDERLAYSEITELSHRLIAETLSRGQRLRAVEDCLVVHYHHRAPGTAETHEERLYAAVVMLQRHGDRYRRVPRSYSNYCNVAGVNAMRLGRFREARKWLLVGLRVWPRRWHSWARLGLALFPPVARRVYGPERLSVRAQSFPDDGRLEEVERP